MTGTHAADFTVTAQPESPVAGSASTRISSPVTDMAADPGTTEANARKNAPRLLRLSALRASSSQRCPDGRKSGHDRWAGGAATGTPFDAATGGNCGPSIHILSNVWPGHTEILN